VDTTEGHPKQGLSLQFASRWRRFAGAWPLFVVILGTVLSFGWTVMLVWIVLGLIGLTT
jgi:hypothetical protein